MPDAAFDDPRLAALYDPLDPDRSGLEAYAAIVEKFGARGVLDLGCGTGTFAVMLGARGLDVVGVDPAAASLDVARSKPGATQVRWILGDATTLPPIDVDLVTMTGNVAQVFCTDAEWSATLHGVGAVLRPGGRLVFETRDPDRRAWEEWNPEQTRTQTDVADVGWVDSWTEVTEVALPLVSFRSTIVLLADGATLTSDSTLRFRTRAEIEDSLRQNGFTVDEVRDAPDRPGRELVVIASRSDER